MSGMLIFISSGDGRVPALGKNAEKKLFAFRYEGIKQLTGHLDFTGRDFQ